MLDHVQRRGLLVEPAREDPLPPAARLLHVQLHERPGQLVELPRRRRLAGAQANDGILDPQRLARAKGDVARNPVTLVEEAQHGDPLVHRGGARGRHSGLLRDCRGALSRLWLIALRTVAARERNPGDKRQVEAAHPYSGVQA